MSLTTDENSVFARHLEAVLSVNSVEIIECNRIHGGASRQTYSVNVLVDGAERGLILRRDPPDSLIDTERSLEYAAYQSFADSDVPVPKMISLVEDAELLSGPFFVMERIDGGAAVSPFTVEAYGEHRDAIGTQFFSDLGLIHAQDALSSPLTKEVEIPAEDACWSKELAYWEGVIDEDELEPQPIVRAAIRWLKRNPPPPAERLVVVHGDYRNGNILHDGAGQLIAVLDWEMAHIGDAHEDLAWSMDKLWNLRDDSRAAGLLPKEEAIALWEASSGLRFNAGAFEFWELFSMVKGLAIWISSSKSYASGANSDPVLAVSGWYCTTFSNSVMVEKLLSLREKYA